MSVKLIFRCCHFAQMSFLSLPEELVDLICSNLTRKTIYNDDEEGRFFQSLTSYKTSTDQVAFQSMFFLSKEFVSFHVKF